MSKESTMAYIRDIAVRLTNPTIYGGASLMVGAGFSKNAEGKGKKITLPNWNELASAMYDELYQKPKSGKENEIQKVKVPGTFTWMPIQ